MSTINKQLVDGNGLELSLRTYSGYKFVTVLFDDAKYRGKYIAYVSVPEDLQEMKMKEGFNQYPLGHQHAQNLGTFDDPRDAAFVAQTFNQNLRANLIDMYKHNASFLEKVKSSIPTWKSPVAETAVKCMHGAAANYRNRKDIFGIKNSFDALRYVFTKNIKDYTLTMAEGAKKAPELRKQIESFCPISGGEFIEAAEIVLEQYKKVMVAA